MATPVSHPPVSELREVLDRAVDRRLITSEQAASILAAEAAEAADDRRPVWATGARPEPVGRLRPLVAEALGYVGAALASVSLLLVAQQFWADLRPWARVGLLALLTVALLIVGVAVRVAAGALGRLRGFVWLLSAGAFAGTGGVALFEYTTLDGTRLAAVVAATTAVYAGILWWRRPRTLQQIAVFAGLVVAGATTTVALDRSLVEFVGLVVWAFGVAWAALAWGRLLRPVRTAYTLGAIAMVLGPRLTGEDAAWNLVLGLVTGVALVAASILLREAVLLGAGVVAIFLYVPMIVFSLFGDDLGAPVSLFVTGVVLVAVAFLLARIRGAGSREGTP